MLPFRVVKQRSVLAGFWFILCTSSSLVVVTYFVSVGRDFLDIGLTQTSKLPLWFQAVRSASAQQSGINILPMLAAVIVGVVASGIVVSSVGYYTPMMLISSALMPVGLGLLVTISPSTHRAALLLYPAIFGFGVGLGFQQPLIGVQTALHQTDIAAGTSVIIFGQTFGAAIVLAAAESVFQHRLVANMEAYVGPTDSNAESLLHSDLSSLTSFLREERSPALISGVSASIAETFYLPLIMACLSVVGSLFMEWKSVRKGKDVTSGSNTAK